VGKVLNEKLAENGERDPEREWTTESERVKNLHKYVSFEGLELSISLISSWNLDPSARLSHKESGNMPHAQKPRKTHS